MSDKDVDCPNCGSSLEKTAVSFEGDQGGDVYKCGECMEMYKITEGESNVIIGKYDYVSKS